MKRNIFLLKSLIIAPLNRKNKLLFGCFYRYKAHFKSFLKIEFYNSLKQYAI